MSYEEALRKQLSRSAARDNRRYVGRKEHLPLAFLSRSVLQYSETLQPVFDNNPELDRLVALYTHLRDNT